MNSKKWIFSKACIYALCFTAATAFGSTTKVGNGDDGEDLEGAVSITSGIIFETRAEAVSALKALNIQGIPGLSMVIPELEHSDLMMAKADVHPLSVEGDWESSDDRRNLFARTFPEPHAPTRFFPAALRLSRAQLIALHTHEALHRALPVGVRDNEEKVALLTMALTSPSATFDRVNRVALQTLPQPERLQPSLPGGTSQLAAAAIPRPLPAPTKTQMNLSHTSSAGPTFQHFTNVETLGMGFSPLHEIADIPVETLLSVDALIVNDPSTSGDHGGPLSFTAKAPIYLAPGKTFGPFAQINLKSLEPANEYYSVRADRDVYTLGVFFENQRIDSYNSLSLSYTLPGTYTLYDTSQNPVTLGIGSIWSLTGHDGFRLSKFSLGGIFEVHHSAGNENYQGPFTIVRAGPEVKWSNGRTTVSLDAEWMLNEGPTTLDDLADIAGHGAGATSATASLGFEL